jgi:hypothetical protein
MVAPFEGGCACGAVRYEAKAEPVAVMECHCRDCQRASGAGSNVAVLVPSAAFAITRGTPKRYARTGDSGSTVTRMFCGDCGSPLLSELNGGPMMVIKAGSMDDPSWITIAGALYTSSAQPWAHIDPNKIQFEKMPPRV